MSKDLEKMMNDIDGTLKYVKNQLEQVEKKAAKAHMRVNQLKNLQRNENIKKYPEKGQRFYYISSFGSINTRLWDENETLSKMLWDKNKGFLTYEEAESALIKEINDFKMAKFYPNHRMRIYKEFNDRIDIIKNRFIIMYELGGYATKKNVLDTLEHFKFEVDEDEL